MLCRECAPAVRDEIDTLRAAGKLVDATRIAYRMLKKATSGGDLLIRGIPADLSKKLGHRAVDERTSKRAVVLAALENYLK